jgi:hypothetical protein
MGLLTRFFTVKHRLVKKVDSLRLRELLIYLNPRCTAALLSSTSLRRFISSAYEHTLTYLLSKQLPPAQRNRLLHQHPNRKPISLIKEIANQRNIPPLTPSLDNRSNRIRAIALERQRPHRSVRNRVGAPEAAGFDPTVQAVRLDREQVVSWVGVLADVDRDHSHGCGDRQTVGVFVEGVHFAGAAELSEALDREADGPAAPDAYDVAGAHFGELAAVPGRGGHVGEAEQFLGGNVVGGFDAGEVCVGDAAEPGLVAWVAACDEGAAEDAREAVAVHALELLRRVGPVAQRVLLALAVVALAAGDDRQDGDPVADLESFDFGSDVFDDADGFVAHDQALFHDLVHVAVVHVQVGAADGAVGDVHDGVLWGGQGGLGDFAELSCQSQIKRTVV